MWRLDLKRAAEPANDQPQAQLWAEGWCKLRAGCAEAPSCPWAETPAPVLRSGAAPLQPSTDPSTSWADPAMGAAGSINDQWPVPRKARSSFIPSSLRESIPPHLCL